MKLKDKIKNLDVLDIGMTKWSAIFFALFLVSVWSGFANWVIRTHWAWFLAVCLMLAIRPIYRFYIK